jgi:hypothetical protein
MGTPRKVDRSFNVPLQSELICLDIRSSFIQASDIWRQGMDPLQLVATDCRNPLRIPHGSHV